MNVALAGLTAREEVALGMLVGKSLPGWQCLPATDARTPLPLANLYVVDLAGRGMARWTEAAQAELLKSLDGVPAVLVAPAFDQTWSALEAHRSQTQPLVLLNKPYGVEAMRAALQQAAASGAAPARSTTAAKPAAPDRARALQVRPASRPSLPAEPDPTLPTGAMPLPAAAERPPLAAPAPVDGALAASEFQARVAALPDAPLFLRRLAQSLAQQHPFELRISFVNRMIFHPGEQWAASNTPAPVLEQLCQHDEVASSIEIDAIDDHDAQARAARLDIPAQPLPALLWKLALHLHGQQV